MREWLSIQPDIKYTKISDRFKKGIPDFILCVQGVYVVLELKAMNGIESKHQELFIKDVVAKGGIGGFCTTLKEVKMLVEQARQLRLQR